ncbi:DUF4097 domain-containing protein [Paenibacillus residui]|uniref:DUF4097 domain-containing protein n=2 Tax=Paenibacillus TaxID=44249 RepID=A0ABW3DGK3_9BACL
MRGSMKIFLAVLFFVAVVIYIVISQGGLSWFASKNVFQEQSVDADKIERININTSSADVQMVSGDAEQIVIKLEGKANQSYRKKTALRVKEAGDTLNVEVNLPNGISFGFAPNDVNLKVELPEKIYKELKLESSSGDLSLDSVNAVYMQLRSSSGDIQVSRFSADLIEFRASSGDISILDGSAELQGETSSGEISIELGELGQDMNLETSSGDIDIRLSDWPSGLDLDFRSGSGDGRVGLEGFEYETDKSNRIVGKIGEGKIKMKVRTSSGDFSLTR